MEALQTAAADEGQGDHEMDQRRPYRIQNFDPLLRDLMAWGLVVRTETDGETHWALVDVVQRRLSELTRDHGPVGVDRLVYLDHKCGECGTRGLTRLVEGAYLCSSCFDRRPAAEPVVGENRTTTTA